MLDGTDLTAKNRRVPRVGLHNITFSYLAKTNEIIYEFESLKVTQLPLINSSPEIKHLYTSTPRVCANTSLQLSIRHHVSRDMIGCVIVKSQVYNRQRPFQPDPLISSPFCTPGTPGSFGVTSCLSCRITTVLSYKGTLNLCTI